jgi:creatinine amidohydrolase/Fe(II)-dependent formamide hydrolase-like protein
MPLHRAEDLTYAQIRRLDRARAIAFLPVSALEVHGPHLPIGMDWHMARWMSGETARRFADGHPQWTAVVLPALAIGADELPLRGSMNTPAWTLYRAVVAHGRALAKAGYGFVVVTNGHGGPRHAAALEAACRYVSRRWRISMFTPSIAVLHRIITGGRLELTEDLLGRRLSDAERHGLVIGEHAGAWETSFMLAHDPSMVDPVYTSLGPLAPPRWKPLARVGDRLAARRERRGKDASKVREAFDGLAGSIGWLLNARFGYGGREVTYKGDPSVASPEIGHAFREILARDCLDVVQAVTAGRRWATDVRSIASDHAVIQPGFVLKATVVVAAVLAGALTVLAF